MIFTGTSVYSGAYRINEGTVEYRDGAQFNAGLGGAGFSPLAADGSKISFLVTGPGTVFNAGTTTAGGFGTSELVIAVTNGGRLDNAGTWRIGSEASGAANRPTLIVSGTDSLLDVGGQFIAGLTGKAVVSVTDGGRIESGVVHFGASSPFGNGNSAAGIISGKDSIWDSSAAFNLYRGSLAIIDQGQLRATAFNIAGSSAYVAEALVSGAGSSITTTGNVTVASAGQGTLTVAQDGKVVVNGGTGTVRIATGGSGTGTLNIGGAEGEAAQSAGFIEAATIAFGAGNGTVNFNHTNSAYDFAPVFAGAGTINQVGSGKTILAQDSTAFAGTTNVRSGTLSVNGILGDSALGSTMHVFGGRLQGNGTVSSTFNHAGGIIAPGNSIGVLTVAGDYTSNGGALEIEAELGADGSPADLLHITGNSLLGTGVTPITVLNVGGTGGVTTGDGILVVQVDGATSEDVFTLARPAIGGAYRYDLFQHDLAGVGGDWFLRGAGVLAPTVPTLENYPVALLGMIELPTLRQRVGEGEANEQGIITRIEGSAGHYEAGSSTSGASYDSSMFLAQIGMAGRLIDTDEGSLTAGLTAQYSRHYANVFSAYGNGSNSTESFGLGASLTWRGSEGSYVDLQGQIAHFNSDLSAAGYSLVRDNGGTGFALGIEAGHTFALDDAWSLTPQGQLNYASVGFDSFTDQFGSQVSLQQGTSLKGRIGLALDHATEWQDAEGRKAASTLYGITNLTYEFLEGTNVAVSGTDLKFVGQKFGAELGVGGTLDWAVAHTRCTAKCWARPTSRAAMPSRAPLASPAVSSTRSPGQRNAALAPWPF